ncbi:S1 family peptidase [Asticcacaulis excentricus]|uniref:Peptidase S1 and S6 chymotrypsin/Hap n=1 Tax=Asticcacaulis excentricus (strain ATCC 15261 / DSM 4724 / KCTC 12464 / NCIMB 9791 / VKM B-1370 / CB 48) TaxID=573065 RepID=E8RPY3_ASTEC|nr:serine protease [Asticcacaulis excentricus]ADU13156.1 peptidase S1 and S6 chymotrypsin/Hap [Asticcacaulis excentricus CB 48]
MTGTPFDASRVQFPGLPVHLLAFFRLENAKKTNTGIVSRTVAEYLAQFVPNASGQKPHPETVVEICRRLVRNGWLSQVAVGGMMGTDNSYFCRADLDRIQTSSVIRLLNCAVYGLPAVYDLYNSAVIPLINWNSKSDAQIGTCFVVASDAIVTALHCVHPSEALAIRGVSPEIFSKASLYVHENEQLDLAVIKFPEPIFGEIPHISLPDEPANVLDEVMALGYPNIPGFVPALAAEAAHVSGRLTVAKGKIASSPTEIFAKTELFLITARVRGGFSGGPLLDSYGQAAGFISREPTSDASSDTIVKYDELGYGVAVPVSAISFLIQSISEGAATPVAFANIKFRDFEE